jgi:hypothetical protein
VAAAMEALQVLPQAQQAVQLLLRQLLVREHPVSHMHHTYLFIITPIVAGVGHSLFHKQLKTKMFTICSSPLALHLPVLLTIMILMEATTHNNHNLTPPPLPILNWCLSSFSCSSPLYQQLPSPPSSHP